MSVWIVPLHVHFVNSARDGEEHSLCCSNNALIMEVKKIVRKYPELVYGQANNPHYVGSLAKKNRQENLDIFGFERSEDVMPGTFKSAAEMELRAVEAKLARKSRYEIAFPPAFFFSLSYFSALRILRLRKITHSVTSMHHTPHAWNSWNTSPTIRSLSPSVPIVNAMCSMHSPRLRTAKSPVRLHKLTPEMLIC